MVVGSSADTTVCLQGIISPRRVVETASTRLAGCFHECNLGLFLATHFPDPDSLLVAGVRADIASGAMVGANQVSLGEADFRLVQLQSLMRAQLYASVTSITEAGIQFRHKWIQHTLIVCRMRWQANGPGQGGGIFRGSNACLLHAFFHGKSDSLSQKLPT